MSTDQTAPVDEADRPTRRRMLQRAALASGAVVAAGLVADVVTAPQAEADTGDPVLAGDQTNAESSTVVYLDGSSTPYPHGAFVVTDTTFASVTDATYKTSAVVGIAKSGSGSGLSNGVVGIASNIGVYGAGADGLYGAGTTNGVNGSGPNGVRGVGTQCGVVGMGAPGADSVGVQGVGGDKGVVGIGSNQGVYGQGPVGVIGVAAAGGVGVSAENPTGVGLLVSGKATFSNSGLAEIAKGVRIVTVKASLVTSTSMVLATLQTADGEIGVAYAVPGKGKFTLALTAHATKKVKVAWFVVG